MKASCSLQQLTFVSSPYLPTASLKFAFYSTRPYMSRQATYTQTHKLKSLKPFTQQQTQTIFTSWQTKQTKT